MSEDSERCRSREMTMSAESGEVDQALTNVPHSAVVSDSDGSEIPLQLVARSPSVRKGISTSNLAPSSPPDGKPSPHPSKPPPWYRFNGLTNEDTASSISAERTNQGYPLGCDAFLVALPRQKLQTLVKLG
ncbi:hypothetical protein A1Q2_06812 [Trichosporon asahii var. asahii CBS 8904]|uniref:Uncharacterized protein n=2 Tax=Trichosporon asahii var. asahii TaxID=189963 RepID=K1VI72_TRIAC|nr:hypothetical protein A1Q1_00986 [Trichosporon asahii var. asahii CBS 2479]EJT49834.1 hypothetical protein A1Q1_00986 [Trichosporon asahii var. asahii CBS 2479]EKC98841.1 hypothetical protein A1Q2_06812 [Trichosporon asahii var. asahii CBS 8904]